MHQAMKAPKANQKVVFASVAAIFAFCSLPFFNKTVLDRENKLAEMRDAQYDAKDEARNQRLSIKRSV